MFVCLLDELILGFCYSDLTLETSGFELASSIILILQANRLTKCASHLSYDFLSIQLLKGLLYLWQLTCNLSPSALLFHF